jgi:hypothetical protein
MNKLEVNQVGGFPMTTRILDEIQKAHAVFNSLGGLAGNFTIIAGCVTIGSTVGDGFVFINGEVFDFKGGLAQTKVIIKEDVENLTFQNGNANPVIKTRYVTFGTGVGAINWTDFKRPIETKEISGLIQRIVDLEARPLVGNIPIGLIAIWGQAANLIPVGWEEYTELSGRFPIGFSADADFDVVGKSGGAKSKTLSVAEMPEHDHAIGNSRRNTGGGSGGDENHPASFAGTRVHITDKQGSGTAFSIMNPFRVVHFIKYKG